MQKRHNCYLGLGSNLKQPIKQISIAIKHISNLNQTQIIQSAPWYHSKAWGVTTQNDFVNTVIHIETRLSPLTLLKAIKIIEYRLMQRQINQKWHARNIDIDILLYAQQQLRRKNLIVPHPLIAQRLFVHKPLTALNPKLPTTLKKSLQLSSKNRFSHRELKKISPRQVKSSHLLRQ